MSKQIEVVVEGFGSQSLRQTFEPRDIQGKNVEDIVKLMLNQTWRGQDAAIKTSLVRKLDNSGGVYIPEIARGGMMLGDRVSFTPARIGDRVDPYIQQSPGTADQLRIAITPAHKTGYDTKY